MPTSAQLKAATDSLEALTSVRAGNPTDAGYWRRFALAAEEAAGADSAANATVEGWMLRAAVALELVAGTSGAEENRTFDGLLKRIVDALEVQAGEVGEGSLANRLVVGAAGAVFDVTPDAFAFTDVANAAVSTQYTSNEITVAGLGPSASVPVTVAGATYSKNGGAYTSSDGVAENGDTFTVRHTSGAAFGQAISTTLTIGGVSDTFTTTTTIAGQLFAAGEQGGWWDISDLASMFQDSAGTTPAAVDQPVGRVNDKSGRGNNLIQATAAQRPTLRQDGARYYLEFDGSDDNLGIAALNLSGGDAVTFCMGVRKNTDTGAVTYLWEHTASFSATQGGLALRHDNGNGNNFEFGTRGSVLSIPASASLAVGSNKVISCLGDISADTARIRVNQVETSAATDQGTGNYANAAFALGRRVNTGSPTAMRLYGLVVRGVLTGAGDLALLETWMNDKTGAY